MTQQLATSSNVAEDEKKALRWADLSGVDLSIGYHESGLLFRTNLSGANLGGATLREANLSGAYLFMAELRSSFLVKADLRWAEFRQANFAGADLREAKNLDKAELPEGWREALQAAGLI